MRIVVFSDAHADWRTGGVDRFGDVRDAVEQVRDAALGGREVADLVLFLGDLADPEDGPRALRAVGLLIDLARNLSTAGSRFVAVAGNHCAIEDGSGESVLTPLSRTHDPRVAVFDRPGVLFVPGGLHVVALPYPSLANAYDPAEFVRRARAQIDAQCGAGTRRWPVVVASHLTEIAGVEPGEESVEMSRGRGVPLPLGEIPPEWMVFNGHFHRGREFRSGGRTVHIPGSLVRLTHGEERHVPRYLVVDVPS